MSSVLVEGTFDVGSKSHSSQDSSRILKRKSSGKKREIFRVRDDHHPVYFNGEKVKVEPNPSDTSHNKLVTTIKNPMVCTKRS